MSRTVEEGKMRQRRRSNPTSACFPLVPCAASLAIVFTRLCSAYATSPLRLARDMDSMISLHPFSASTS